MPLQATSGAASYDAFGGGVPVTPVYIEDVMSVWLYTGNGSTQTITTGVDTGTKGGLIWVKMRAASASHCLFDSARASGSILSSNTTDAATPGGSRLALTATGFDLQSGGGGFNQSGSTYASWTFREQPKFFDVVTYTGTGANRTITHNLGSVPGCIIIKRTDAVGGWSVYHRSLANTQYMILNGTEPAITNATFWNSTAPTDTVFSLGTNATVNTNGGTYVAYLFAHNAGGFGLTGTDNVISCGSYTGTGDTTNTVTLGYEPQFVIVKRTDGAADWQLLDTMRGMPNSATAANILFPNLSAAESTGQNGIAPTATGFRFFNTGTSINGSGLSYIYIAIRRGPMKVPTTGTSVFSPQITSNDNTTLTTGFTVDAVLTNFRAGFPANTITVDRLRGGIAGANLQYLVTSSTAAENSWSVGGGTQFATQNGFSSFIWGAGNTVFYFFRRAPGFFDEVCYTGTGANRTVAHNLAAVPELMLVKKRSSTGGWVVYSAFSGPTKYQYLNTTAAAATISSTWNNTAPTASVFTVGTDSEVNGSGVTYVAYLFASCPGVSKVTNFTGNGTSQTINCGFTSGARFVMIKATSTTGNWTVFDSARGISAGGDPALYLNSTAAEVTGVDAIDADSTGFIVNQEGTFNLNASGVQYLVLAIS